MPDIKNVVYPQFYFVAHTHTYIYIYIYFKKKQRNRSQRIINLFLVMNNFVEMMELLPTTV